VHIRREKRNTQEGNAGGKSVGGRAKKQSIDVGCIQMMYVPKNYNVCENIKHKNHEYREEIYAGEEGRP
jgi:metal-responsive CopG/Arc/MetJ family transcriptional regulator